MKQDKEKAEAAIHSFLEAIGEDPTREGLRKTPHRVAKAWEELVGGYNQDPQEVLRTSDGELGFREEGVDQMIVEAGIQFTSTCEHHLLPFLGEVDVGYLPGPSQIVVGASKLPRLVEVFARRLQLQERMTQEIATSLEEAVKPMGVGVRVRAVHLCMACRGIRKRAPMATEVLLGKFRESEVRAEFWSLADYARKLL